MANAGTGAGFDGSAASTRRGRIRWVPSDRAGRGGPSGTAPEPAQEPSRRRRFVASALVVAFFGLCVAPRLGRLGHPSLIVDDLYLISVVGSEGGLSSHLFTPHNDHVLPLFLAWTWVLWKAGGGLLANAPLACTVGGFVPFLICLPLLRSLVRRELGSETAALAAVALFALSSWVYDETIYWYAASSFMWALALTMVAWRCSASASEGGSRLGWIGAALAALAAPGFLLIGLLTGPIATLRALAARPAPGARWRGTLACLAPMVGTGLYLALVSLVQARHARQSAWKRLPSLLEFEVFQSIVRAPLEVLLPAMAGLYRHVPLPNIIGAENVRGLPWAVALGGTIVGLLAAGAWASRSRHRAMIAGALGLIYGGYVLTLSFDFPGPYYYRISIERYHLFPHLGMVLLITAGLLPAFRRLDGAPIGRLFAAVGLASALLATHGGIAKRAKAHYQAPDQVRALAAMDHLARICEREGITKQQAIAAFDPVSRKTWFPHDRLGVHNLLILLRSHVTEPRMPDALVRSTLLGSLSADEVAALCGGSDVTAHVSEPVGDPEVPEIHRAPTATHLVEDRGDGLYVVPGWDPARRWPPFVEFTLLGPAGGSSAASGWLVLGGASEHGEADGVTMEVWWSGDEGVWSVERSVFWQVRPTRLGWSVPIDRLPHWEPSGARRIRVVFRSPAVVALRATRLEP